MMTNDFPFAVSTFQCGNDYLALSSNDNDCSLDHAGNGSYWVQNLRPPLL